MKKIIQYRARSGMTQAQLAKALGVQRATVIAWEKPSTRRMDAKSAKKACAFFGCTIPELYGPDCFALVDFEPANRREAAEFIKFLVDAWKGLPK